MLNQPLTARVQTNAMNLTYTLGHNEWSDMTESEFNDKMLGGFVRKSDSEKNIDHTLAARAADAPDSKDWVTLGAVTPIKNQVCSSSRSSASSLFACTVRTAFSHASMPSA